MKKPKIKLPQSGEMIGRLKTRSFRVGGYSVLATVIVVAIAVFANILVNALPAKYTQFDTTSSQLYSISEQTELVLSELEDEVTVYWIVQDGREDETLGTLLDRYAAMSSKLTVTKVDPDVQPTFVQKYADGTIYNNSLVVECGERNTYISYSDIYEYDYSNYYSTGTYEQSFAGESELTSAIDYVTNDELPKLYALTGHGESELSTSFETAVAKQNVEIESLSLLTTDGVPEDADCLLINAPMSDISESERDSILEYLASGGKLILVTGPLQDGTELTNLEAVMEYYGVTAADGIVVEGSDSNYLFPAPINLLPEYGSHEITSPLSEGGYYMCLPLAQGLIVGEAPRDTVSVTELLTTSDSAYSKLSGYTMSTYEKEDGDIDGPFALAVAITETLEDGGETDIIWVSSAYLLDDSTNASISGGNEDFFLNCINWLCGSESGISIHAKSLSTEYLTISSGTSSMLTMLVVGVIPVCFLAAGIVIWVRRKKQ